MDHLISLSQAKLMQEDLDMRCLRKAVLVQNALRLGVPLTSPVAVVPVDPMSLHDGTGYAFRNNSSVDAPLDTYQTREQCPTPREHHPHFMVDVTNEVEGGSPPLSPLGEDSMDALEYGVVPTTAPVMSAYTAQPLIVEQMHAGSLPSCASVMHDVIGEEVPEFSLTAAGSNKRAVAQHSGPFGASYSASFSVTTSSKRVCMSSDVMLDGSIIEWMS